MLTTLQSKHDGQMLKLGWGQYTHTAVSFPCRRRLDNADNMLICRDDGAVYYEGTTQLNDWPWPPGFQVTRDSLKTEDFRNYLDESYMTMVSKSPMRELLVASAQGVCPDCNGSKIYQGLQEVEPCRTCQGK